MPAGPFRLPGRGRDGVLRAEGDVLARLIHLEGQPVVVRAWATRGGVRLRGEGASTAVAHEGVERMRFALGVHHDLSDFQRRFRWDPLIGPVIRHRPWLRPRRRPEPFEALAWAICEQLIESGRAAEIERRIVRRWGPRSACGRLRDVPSCGVLAGRAPAELERCGLAAGRALAMVKVAREVHAGRVDLTQHEPAWRRLRTIRGIGSWTLEMLAFEGQGRDDQLPAGDVAYLKLVGRLARLGRRASEDEVREFFRPYEPYAGLAGLYLRHGSYLGLVA